MSADVVGLPAEWVHIGTGAAYTLTGLSNLRAENREQWPVMAHYTGADGRRWTRTLASFVGSMRAGTGCPMGTESVPVEPEESPAVPEPDVAEATSGLPEGWREIAPGQVWVRGEGGVVVVKDLDPLGFKPYEIHADGDYFDCSHTIDDAIKAADECYPASEHP